VVHALAAAFGLAAVLALHPQALQWIQWAGAAYLVVLGVGMLRQAWQGGAAGSELNTTAKAVKPFWADFRTGLFTNVLNPKVALFFLAFLPQFVPAGTPNATLSFLLLGAWFVVQSMVFLLVLVLMLGALSAGALAGAAGGAARHHGLGWWLVHRAGCAHCRPEADSGLSGACSARAAYEQCTSRIKPTHAAPQLDTRRRTYHRLHASSHHWCFTRAGPGIRQAVPR